MADDLGNDLKQLLGIRDASTVQEALALSTAFQETSARKLIGSVDKLARSTTRIGFATWVLVSLTTVLAVFTAVLVWAR